MAVKTITITEEAYNILKLQKKEEESFTELIKRIYSNHSSIEDLRGSLKDDPDIDKLYDRVMTERKQRRAAAQLVLAEGKKKYDHS